MTITAADLQNAFAGFSCNRMQRAWRNRSNVTCWAWEDRAGRLGDRRLAAVLYAACSELHPGQVFDPSYWPANYSAAFWATIAARLPALLKNPPERALSRGQYEQRQSLTPADVCHQLYNALQTWRSGKTARADIWT
jgi:hypothetical protein